MWIHFLYRMCRDRIRRQLCSANLVKSRIIRLANIIAAERSTTVTNLRTSLRLSRTHTRKCVKMFGKRLRRVAINVIGKSGSLLFFASLLQASSCFIVVLIQFDTCSTNIYMYTDTHTDTNKISVHIQ